MQREPFDPEKIRTPGNPGGQPVDPSLEIIAGQVIGAAIEVHKVLGPGFVESVYEEALAAELELRNIPYARQTAFRLEYKGRPVGEGRTDFIIADGIVLELKAVDAIAPVHKGQLAAYLRATKRRYGLLINFNEAVLKDGIRRVLL
jgi:GxxExxY protein